MKVLLFANTAWYLYNFRRALAMALRERGVEVLMVSPQGPYGDKLMAMGFRWVPAPMRRRSLNPWREAALIRWLSQLMIREHVDVVHGFTIKCAIYGSLAARLARVPARVNAVAGMGYVFTSRDLTARLLRPPVRLLLRLALAGKNARLILQNEDDVAFFIDQGLIDSARVRLIPGSGVDCRHFTPQPRPPGNSTFRVLLAARLLWDKGLAEYADAARLIIAEGRDVQFLLAGEPDPGNPAAVPLEMIQQWQAEGIVHWLGHVDDMPSLFRSVDAVVLPSYREGLPKSLAEAAASGLPLIATDVPGCRDIVSDNIDGLLVPVKDAAALASAIATLHGDPALRTRLGNAARAKALSNFDEQIIVGRTLSVYRELVGQY